MHPDRLSHYNSGGIDEEVPHRGCSNIIVGRCIIDSDCDCLKTSVCACDCDSTVCCTDLGTWRNSKIGIRIEILTLRTCGRNVNSCSTSHSRPWNGDGHRVRTFGIGDCGMNPVIIRCRSCHVNCGDSTVVIRGRSCHINCGDSAVVIMTASKGTCRASVCIASDGNNR